MPEETNTERNTLSRREMLAALVAILGGGAVGVNAPAILKWLFGSSNEAQNSVPSPSPENPTPEPQIQNTEIDYSNDPVVIAGRENVIDTTGINPAALAEIKDVTDPMKRPIYLGITPNNQDWEPDTASIQETVNLIEKNPAIIQFYQDWSGSPRASQFNPEWMDSIRERGALPNITWMPGDARTWGQQEAPDFKKFALKNIANGDFDEYITKWAQDAAAWGKPFFLRFGHEMNGHHQFWPYPWLTAPHPHTGERLNTPQDFVQAWIHVHDIFKQVGADNVTWVWCPDSAGDLTDLENLYPGDSYVDWTGFDIYNWGNQKNPTDFQEKLTEMYNRLVTMTPNKPQMLSEFGSQQKPEQKAEWAKRTFLVEFPYRFPQIQAVLYFDKHKEDEGRNWRINTGPEVQAEMAHAFSSHYYTGGEFGQLEQSPIPVAKNVI